MSLVSNYVSTYQLVDLGEGGIGYAQPLSSDTVQGSVVQYHHGVGIQTQSLEG